MTKKNVFESLISPIQSSLKTEKNKPDSKNSSQHQEMPHQKDLANSHSLTAHKKGPITRIIVKYDVGFNNSIFLRGEGAGLNWDRGIMLKNIKFDEWVWETNLPFTNCEFKVLINDRQYELGENHHLHCGTSFEYTPHFHNL